VIVGGGVGAAISGGGVGCSSGGSRVGFDGAVVNTFGGGVGRSSRSGSPPVGIGDGLGALAEGSVDEGAGVAAASGEGDGCFAKS
jgi:hypothetical protein